MKGCLTQTRVFKLFSFYNFRCWNSFNDVHGLRNKIIETKNTKSGGSKFIIIIKSIITSHFCGILFYVFSKHFLLNRILHNTDRNIPRFGHEMLQYAPTVWPCTLLPSYTRDTASLLLSSACVALSHCQDTLQVKHTSDFRRSTKFSTIHALSILLMNSLVVPDMSVESCTEFIAIVAVVAREIGTVLGLDVTDNVHPIYGLKTTVKAEAGKSVLNRIFVDEGLPL